MKMYQVNVKSQTKKKQEKKYQIIVAFETERTNKGELFHKKLLNFQKFSV